MALIPACSRVALCERRSNNLIWSAAASGAAPLWTHERRNLKMVQSAAAVGALQSFSRDYGFGVVIRHLIGFPFFCKFSHAAIAVLFLQ